VPSFLKKGRHSTIELVSHCMVVLGDSSTTLSRLFCVPSNTLDPGAVVIMAYTDDAVLAKLSALNETQESIVTVAQWVMFHRYEIPRARVFK